MKVFLHTRSAGKHDWTNNNHEFARIPVIGEFVTLSTTGSWFQIELVVHTPFPCDCDAEVYAVEVDHSAVKREALKG